MRKRVKKLLYIQSITLVVLLLISALFMKTEIVFAILAGGLMAIGSTLMAMLLLRRMPEVISARLFYQMMIIYELIKWAVVVATGIILVRYFNAMGIMFALPGLIVGFATCYLGYFLLLLVD